MFGFFLPVFQSIDSSPNFSVNFHRQLVQPKPTARFAGSSCRFNIDPTIALVKGSVGILRQVAR
jgi:hypothetical protein